MTDRPPALEDVFRTLDRWRHLPAYRLEPNLAPFFGLFLRDILHRCMETETHPIIIPEFPLHKGVLLKENCTKADEGSALEEGKDNNLSFNVDYIVFSRSLEKVYFVELKTDSASIRSKQIKYLKKAKCTNFDDILKGITKICETTAHKQKYIHLLHHLGAIGLVTFQGDKKEKLYEMTFPKVRSGWTNTFQYKLSPITCSLETEIVYITPTGNDEILNGTGFKKIGFRDVIAAVKGRGDLGRLFACYLDEWIEPAGIRDPRQT